MKDILIERKEKALAVIDDIDWTLEQVECDDYGDPYWRWHAVYTLGGGVVWDEYWHDKPDDTRICNTLLEAIKEGSAGDRVADVLTQKGDEK